MGQIATFTFTSATKKGKQEADRLSNQQIKATKDADKSSGKQKLKSGVPLNNKEVEALFN